MKEQPDSCSRLNFDLQDDSSAFKNCQIQGDRYIPRRLMLDNSDTMFEKKSFFMESESQLGSSETKKIDENTKIY